MQVGQILNFFPFLFLSPPTWRWLLKQIAGWTVFGSRLHLSLSLLPPLLFPSLFFPFLPGHVCNYAIIRCMEKKEGKKKEMEESRGGEGLDFLCTPSSLAIDELMLQENASEWSRELHQTTICSFRDKTLLQQK